ncbi:MAG: hypothetical protein Q9M12_08400 [Mariprofundus sp.]|nr:hypothetical protein [Mariprofundus sp.]
MDHKGEKRDDVIHLFGDGQQVIDLTESMTCKHTYLSSVLSFTQEESARLNVDDIRNLAESFAAHHAEPMGVEAIAGCAYLHVEAGRYDVHLVQVQMDMESGKRVDLYLDSCGDTQRIADWQDCKNYELKLDDPRDPSRMRLTNDKVRESKDREEMRRLVNNHLEQQTLIGALTHRTDVIRELQSLGFEITRRTKKAISIKSPDLNQTIRLTGAIFHESFTGIEGVRSAIEAGQRRSKEDYRQHYETARTRLAESNGKRTARISKKLKIDLEARSQRTPQGHSPNVMADLDSIGHQLSAAHRNRTLVNSEGQHPDPYGNAGELPDAAISGQPIRHRPESQRHPGQERQLLDKTQIGGTKHEHANHQVTNHRAHVQRIDRHSATMQAISSSSQQIERASQLISDSTASGGEALHRARKTTHAAIERITVSIGAIVVKVKQKIATVMAAMIDRDM